MVSATKKPGRPQTGVGTPVQVRLDDERLRALDAWRRTQEDLPGRPEAVLRLTDTALAARPKGRK
jgi:hypothetical protein